jgi:hypothetical protein
MSQPQFNVVLEIISMFSETTREAMRKDLELAKAQARAELSEGDLSKDAEQLMYFHIACADASLALLQMSEAERKSLDDPQTHILAEVKTREG